MTFLLQPGTVAGLPPGLEKLQRRAPSGPHLQQGARDDSIIAQDDPELTVAFLKLQIVDVPAHTADAFEFDRFERPEPLEEDLGAGLLLAHGLPELRAHLRVIDVA